jgi:hypothetical protein
MRELINTVRVQLNEGVFSDAAAEASKEAEAWTLKSAEKSERNSSGQHHQTASDVHRAAALLHSTTGHHSSDPKMKAHHLELSKHHDKMSDHHKYMRGRALDSYQYQK